MGWVSDLLSPRAHADGPLAHYREVIVIVYRYMSLLRKQPPEERVFDEIKALTDIEFRFHEPTQGSAYASEVAKKLQAPVPREKVISARWLVERFDPDAIMKALQFLDIRKGNVAVTAKVMPPGVGPLDRTEPVYMTKYRKDRMFAEITAALKDVPTPELFLPGPNRFIPKDFHINKVEVDKVGCAFDAEFAANSSVAEDSAQPPSALPRLSTVA